MASVAKRPDGQWRARYRDAAGKEHARHFPRKIDAQQWLDTVTSSVVTGTYVDPKTARTTVGEWCDTWLEGYGTRRSSTVRQAQVHVAKIRAEFGGMRLSTLKPSHVRSWTAKLKSDGAADSYVYALHARLSQILADAVHDGVIARNPCSRRTSPGAGKQRPYVATTAQVWALHDAMPMHLRPAVLLGAFAGLRTAEVCGLRVSDVDYMRGVVTPEVQYPLQPLKSDASRTPVPIPRSLAVELSKGADARTWVVETFVGDQVGPWQIDRAIRETREAAGMPAGFRFHDLRHYFASLLISSGSDVKVVQARLRHASATTTLNTYAHLWPDTEESTRTAVDQVLAARADSLRTTAT
jgi:integrase